MAGGIADILYVRFRVPDLAQQARFLEDFGLQVEQDGPRLLARGTDPSPYVYVAEQGETGFLGLGFETLSGDYLEMPAVAAAAQGELEEGQLEDLKAIGYLQGVEEDPAPESSESEEPDPASEQDTPDEG